MDSATFYSVITQLNSEDEQERLNAVYTLDPLKDKRAVPYLLRILRDQGESPQVRGQAAENLKFSRKRQTMNALVECSGDASPEVRFWCVFALGSFLRHRKTPLTVVRALEKRLEDTECPNDLGHWWSVGLEALAMLQAYKRSRLPVQQMFRETILNVIRDPLRHSDKWRWADCYWHDQIAGVEGCALYDSALQKIAHAGFEVVRFGMGTTGKQ
jgi:HEAT repeat protein